MKNISFGQYYPADSFVHNLDPRIKILLMTAFIISIFFIKSFFGYVIIAAFILLCVIFSKVPFGSVLRSVKGILFLVLFTMILNLFFVREGNVILDWKIIKITDYGVLFTAKMALRLVLLVMGTSLLTLTTTPMSLTDGLESLMKPLKLIRFPVHDVALIMSMALRLIPSLMDEAQKIMNAQKARAASFDSGNVFQRAKAMLPVLIPLFISSFRRADELALALDARCYNATPNRTKMKKLKAGWRDVVATFVTAGFITVIMLDTFLWMGVF